MKPQRWPHVSRHHPNPANKTSSSCKGYSKNNRLFYSRPVISWEKWSTKYRCTIKKWSLPRNLLTRWKYSRTWPKTSYISLSEISRFWGLISKRFFKISSFKLKKWSPFQNLRSNKINKSTPTKEWTMKTKVLIMLFDAAIQKTCPEHAEAVGYSMYSESYYIAE